ncbi:hypothetical protein ACJX0J_022087, partial [Zea mays]
MVFYTKKLTSSQIEIQKCVDQNNTLHIFVYPNRLELLIASLCFRIQEYTSQMQIFKVNFLYQYGDKLDISHVVSVATLIGGVGHPYVAVIFVSHKLTHHNKKNTLILPKKMAAKILSLFKKQIFCHAYLESKVSNYFHLFILLPFLETPFSRVIYIFLRKKLFIPVGNSRASEEERLLGGQGTSE